MKKENLPQKTCLVCNRPFTWRKKWEKVWHEVKFCSERCRGDKNKIKPSVQSIEGEDLDRLIRMAWEDRTPFEAILAQFGLSETDVMMVMKRELTSNRYEAWRKRLRGRESLKRESERDFKVGAFKSRMQRIDGSVKTPLKKKRA